MKPASNADHPEWELLVDDTGRLTFAHPAQARAYLRAKFAGQCIVGQFYEHRSKRSDRQNRAGHALCWEWLRWREGWTLGALKLYALGGCFGYLEVVHPVTGEILLFPAKPHSSELTVEEFCKWIDWILQHAAEEDGVVLVAPDEYRRAREALARKAARETRKGAA